MKQDVKVKINSTKIDFLHDLRQMLQIKSVKGEPAFEAPFGKGPKEALQFAAQLGKSYGFKTEIVDNSAVSIQWGDDDTHYVGIFGHLDVVPAGSNWSVSPFDLTKREKKFFGRGILDNKGPSMACLYGMKLLKEMGMKPAKTIRLVLGSDEENESADMERYLKHMSAPDIGFTPDCKYPAVYGERGIVSYEITTPIPNDELDSFQILNPKAQSSDHVPDLIKAVLTHQEIEVTGKRSPSNAPELGVNAITLLAKKIDGIPDVSVNMRAYFHWLASLHNEHYGHNLGIEFEDHDSGKLIMTPYQLEKKSGKLILSIAIRYPVSVSENQVTQAIQTHVLPNSTIRIVRSMPGVMHKKEAVWIKQLSKVYEQVTGLDGTPVTTTGATYARKVPNIIAFGPSFPGQKGIAHKQDEYMDEQDLFTNMEIYMKSMMVLGQMEDD
ncbi:Sapep family Mn(2+)-dependent dipeptidase [Pediococcus ethanolidurans]|uniref:Dipeptidase n=1 Tax=Pediococcus ethanolidurans TaxID=319653 RepID=A0A0R2K6E4_9LACO|nr:Sapep family Mn(2+)-dependent dipeptidase [Pediococcus ethanolidurans]KRN82170.1 dipeptidase [Pediococcus ethanolidurans]GEN95240.1 peptidase M20 [Pediococcus ethanolidurans]SER66971.1 dipeptidase, putative [Pediococcus ethanolidurans]